MKTYCITYTPKGIYTDPRQIMAHREFVDEISTKQEAFSISRKLHKEGNLSVYIDQYDGEPDDQYQALVNYWRVLSNGSIA